MKHLLLVFMMGSLCFVAQAQGIEFEKGLGWNEVLQRAKLEHKYIFIDCYATWCGPCKDMDKDVYSKDSIGVMINEKFVSARLQMDSSAQDNPEVRSWYATAHEMRAQYHIKAYPCYLFFSPDGIAVHMDLGYKKIDDFMTMCGAALDPNRQYFTLIEAFRLGQKNYQVMPYLAEMASRLKNDSLAGVVASDYMHGFLTGLTADKLWTKENIGFIEEFGRQVHSTDDLFKRYYNERKLIDAALADSGYSNDLINRIVYREEVRKKIDLGIAGHFEPNWSQIERNITSKYNKDFVAKNVIRGRVEYYKETKTWSKYASYFIQQMELAGLDHWPAGGRTSNALNNDAFEVFEYSNSKKELQKALTWANRAVAMQAPDPSAQILDTKANLLYKLGRVEEGKALEQQSIVKDPSDQEIAESYKKMKIGLPTWPVQ